jgi:hypothetical protein
MLKVFLLILSLTLCACSEYSTNARLDGLSRPSDLMPEEFPTPPPATDTHN